MISAIITCAGKGERAGKGYNKLLADIGGVTPFEKCLAAFAPCSDEIIITCTEEDEPSFKEKAAGTDNVKFVRGGKTRFLSVYEGLKAANGDIAVVHDGARPFVTERIIKDCIASAEKYGSGVAAIPSVDTVAKTDGKNILSSGRKNVFLVQTPQAFVKADLLRAYSLAEDGEEFTDESGLYGKYIGACRIVEGDKKNVKLTYPEDFRAAEDLYVGTGFDLHLFANNRKLMLGGIEIPYVKGLLGHSDADVLLHAITDALLSSASLPDIGRLFPDTDPAYEGISSAILLGKALGLLKDKGFSVKNVSAVIMAQKPKLAPYVDKIKQNVADILGVAAEAVGITCTTLEGIGTVGREEGIAVQAYCLTRKKNG